jgi:hypothetical protein
MRPSKRCRSVAEFRLESLDRRQLRQYIREQHLDTWVRVRKSMSNEQLRKAIVRAVRRRQQVFDFDEMWAELGLDDDDEEIRHREAA